MTKFTFHPVAEMFPLIEGEEFDELVEDIRKHGQREPMLVVKTGSNGTLAIVDGRNRKRACDVIGRKPAFKVWNGKGSLAELACSLNLRRRHLNPSQKAAAAVGVKEQFAIEARQRMLAGKKNPPANLQEGEAAELAAKACGVSPRQVYDAALVRKHDPRLFNEVIAGGTSLNEAKSKIFQARKLAMLPPKKARVAGAREWKVIVGDCVEVMRAMPSACARVVFADPPYNNGWKYDADPTGDKLLPDEYLAWCRTWMEAAAKLLAPDGSLFVLIDDNYSDFFGVELRKLGLFRRNTICWWEHFPNHLNGNFSHAVRFIHYFTKSAKGFIWNPQDMMVPSRRNELGDPRGVPEGKVPDNVWLVTRKVGNATDRVPFEDAPPQVPDDIPRRCILVASNPGDLVVDPFNGNGTSGRAAVTGGRRYIGIDRSRKYAEQSEQWIAAALAAAKGGK